MKISMKIAVMLTVVTLIFAFAGKAMAYFEWGSLVRVVWERQSPATPSGQWEVLNDLGRWDHLTTPYAGPNVTPSSPPFTLGQLDLSSWSNVYVAYFMVQIGAPDHADVWLSGITTGVQRSGARQGQPFYTRSGTVLGANYLSGQPQNVRAQSEGDSFVNQFTNSGRIGNFLASGHIGHASLSSFEQPGTQYVDQYLYFYNEPDEARNGVPILVLRTWETGLTEIQPIPIPPAVYLLGTGLLGLIGIRRRIKDVI